jgi:hypothetical protein
MNSWKPLPAKWATFLASQPETGMSYQIVTVTLADGRTVEDVVINGGIIGETRGHTSVPFDPETIVKNCGDA